MQFILVGTGVTNNHFFGSTLLVKVVFHYYWSDYGGIRTLLLEIMIRYIFNLVNSNTLA